MLGACNLAIVADYSRDLTSVQRRFGWVRNDRCEEAQPSGERLGLFPFALLVIRYGDFGRYLVFSFFAQLTKLAELAILCSTSGSPIVAARVYDECVTRAALPRVIRRPRFLTSRTMCSANQDHTPPPLRRRR